MLIATWNVNGVRARQVRLLEWLNERKPDVVCLQELKVKEEDFPHDELKVAGYHATIVGQQSWNGVGVLAKEKPEAILRELPGAESAGARFLSVRTAGIEIASIYVPNGKVHTHPDFPLKLAWLDKLASYTEARADKEAPFVLTGDFNICPTDLDSYLGDKGRGTIFHTDEERSRYGRIIASGLIDLYRSKYPAEPGYSFWDYRAGAFHRKLGMRIDLLLTTGPIASRMTDVRVDREFRKKSKLSKALPSDHAPVILELTS
jgi:exodeoxyribonuclease-3